MSTNNLSFLEKELSDCAKEIGTRLRSVFEGKDPDYADVLCAEEYSALAGGKRIRPFLVRSFCRLFCGSDEAAYVLGTALEMVHTYSLIHDDLPCMDNDDLRRGMPTCHKKFGEATALLAGDGLLTGAFGVISDSPALSDRQKVRAISLLSASAGDRGMIAGQTMDLAAEENPVTETTLRKIHSLKTGCLIKAACLLGLVAADVDHDDGLYSSAGLYADHIGVAFQMVDDLLDVVGDTASLGKKTGSDAENNKTTYLTFHGIDEMNSLIENETCEALAAVAHLPGSELLSDFAVYLSIRRK